MNNIVLTGGGTAGHIMPNIALLPDLKKRFDNLAYIGEVDGMEQKIAEKAGLPFYSTPAVKLIRGKVLSNIKIPFVLASGIKKARTILKRLNPSVVFSKGGYCALPTVFAAKSLKIPVICHESDMTVGLANRVSLPFADALITSFSNTYSKGVCLGLPIRERVFIGNAKIVRALFKVERPIILFMGGSLGAKAINECLEKSLTALSDYNIIHIKGGSAVRRAENYHSIEFAENIEDYFAAADLIVSRAGANTLAELAALGKRVLAVPLPKGASRGDQVDNAAYYKKEKMIEVLPQEKLTPFNLVTSVKDMLNSPPPQARYDRSVPDKIADFLLSKCKLHDQT
jgi:UDP-N-acetylglucosamine--N-acetylmuramyl-(pentapeptide) pyrophosphoryl-undecaprenol N-acetylglucosamine transferase